MAALPSQGSQEFGEAKPPRNNTQEQQAVIQAGFLSHKKTRVFSELPKHRVTDQKLLGILWPNGPRFQTETS